MEKAILSYGTVKTRFQKSTTLAKRRARSKQLIAVLTERQQVVCGGEFVSRIMYFSAVSSKFLQICGVSGETNSDARERSNRVSGEQPLVNCSCLVPPT